VAAGRKALAQEDAAQAVSPMGRRAAR